MKPGHNLLIALLVALVRLAEQHPDLKKGRRYVLTVPEAWDAYAVNNARHSG